MTLPYEQLQYEMLQMSIRRVTLKKKTCKNYFYISQGPMSESNNRYLYVRRFYSLSRISAFMTQSIILMAAVST